MPRRPRALFPPRFDLLPFLSAALLAVSCALPLAWLVWQIAADPTTLLLLRPDRIRWDILGRTCGYGAAAAVVATLLAIPAGLVLGRLRGWFAGLVALALPVTLLLPSLTYAYGWAQFFRLAGGPLGRLLVTAGVDAEWLRTVGVVVVNRGTEGPRAFLDPAGPADAARCVWSLATWLWPVPAGAMAWALRRADPAVRQQALLDGAAGRLALRQVLAPALVGGLAVWVLAGQEFAVYEPTGISVVATEVRQVFETGSFSSGANPITQPMGGGMFTGEDLPMAAGGGGPMVPPPAPPVSNGPQDVQQRAAAAAVATGVPMLVLTAAVGLVVALACRRWSAASDDVHEETAATRPVARASSNRGGAVVPGRFVPTFAGLAVAAVLLVTLGVPIVSLLLRHQRPLDPVFVWRQSGDLILGSLLMAALAGAAAGVLALAGTRRPPSWGLLLALATFLVGGQLLAIALIRLYNRPRLGWVYNAPPIMVMAYVGRFGWLALLAAAATWSRPWRGLRAQAAVDGAGPAAAARHVVWPLAWPLVAGGALLVLVLSLTEVPATVLARPHRPPQIVPFLMTSVHTLESDPMIEASLLLASVVAALSVVATGLFLLARRAVVRARSPRIAIRGLGAVIGACLVVGSSGCGEPGAPDEVWMSTGTGPGQVVYPRAITYSKSDDTFFVIDRVARVQHFDRKGNHLNGWQMPEFQYGKPVGLSVGPDGNVYVADTHYHRVMVYSPDGHLLRQWGGLGKEKGQFIFPTDVAFDEQNRVFVSEYGEHDRVQVFDGQGTYLYEFGRFGTGDGEFSRPQSLVIDKGLVYLTDSCNHRICVFRTDGTFVRNIGSVGSDLGQFRFPYGMDIDEDGRLVVCEFGNNRVQLVDKETGKGLKTWGAAGRDPGQLAYPWGVAVDKGGRVVTIDSGNNRLQVFSF